MTEIPLAAAALAGLVSFLSPCVLPLVPGYVSFVSGVSLAQLQAAEPSQLRRALAGAVWFVLGFSTVFVILGASATVVGQLLLQRLTAFRWIAGVAVMLFGLHLTGLIRIPWLNYDRHLPASGQRPLTWLGAYGVGAAFGFGWTPCIGPILAGILAVASVQETVWQGIALLAAYSAGLGVPFLLTAMAVGTFLKTSGVIKRHGRWIEMISGILLIIIGALILTDRLAALAGSFTIFNRFSL